MSQPARIQRLEVPGHGQAGERGVGAKIARELGGQGGVRYGSRPPGNPELAERVMAARISDIIPLAHLDDPGVLDGRAVEPLHARAQHGLCRDPLEMVAVAAGRQPEVALVLGMRLGRPVEQQNLLRRLVVPGGRIEDRQVLPGMVRMGRENRVPVVAFQLHTVSTSGCVQGWR